MRIAYFLPTMVPALNGIVRRMRATLKELSQRGDEVMIVAPQMAGLPEDYEGYPVLAIPSVPLLGYQGYQYALPWYPSEGAQQRLIAFRPEIVHALDPVTGLGWLAHELAVHLRVPLVLSYHTNLNDYLVCRKYGFLEPLLWQALSWIYAHATMTLCPSTSTQRLLHAHDIPYVQLWRSGVDTTIFHPERGVWSWRERLTQGHPDRCILLVIGRLAPEKEIERLFPLLETLNSDPNARLCHLAVIGDGPFEKELKREAAGLPITFVGPLADATLAAAEASGDIFCQLSTTETFGNATLEAMACGLPVVAARAGGTLDLITEGQTGLLFDPHCPDQLLDTLRLLRDHPDIGKGLGAAAQKAATSWSWSVSTHALCQLYRQAQEHTTPLPKEVVAR